jgi:hypothetical protein
MGKWRDFQMERILIPTHTPLFPSLLYYVLVLFNLMLFGWTEIKKSRGKEMTKIYLKMSTFHFQELFILL